VPITLITERNISMKTKILAIVATSLLALSAFAVTDAAKSGAKCCSGSCGHGQSSCCHDCCNHK
jgi:hypothetical protein